LLSSASSNLTVGNETSSAWPNVSPLIVSVPSWTNAAGGFDSLVFLSVNVTLSTPIFWFVLSFKATATTVTSSAVKVLKLSTTNELAVSLSFTLVKLA